MGRTRHVPQRASSSAPDQSGSAIVAALALAMILTILAAGLAARSVGAVGGAAGAHDRLAARVAAEHLLGLSMVMVERSHAALVHGGPSGGRPTSEDVEALVAGFEGASEASVDIRPDGRDTVIGVVTVVGVARGTAHARLRPVSSVDLAWFTESSAHDPLLRGMPRLACTWPEGDPRRHPTCAAMPLPHGEIAGPVHSNDPVPATEDTSFGSLVTTADLEHPGDPHHPEMRLPRDARALTENGGTTCRFRGPTLLRFDGPTVRVRSPRSAPRDDEPEGPAATVGCMGIDRSALVDVIAIELPQEAVIEVIADPADDCVLHPLGIAIGEDLERDWRCDAGDAFVWGRYLGTRSVIAHDSVQVVWDLEPGDATAPSDLQEGDTMGLVAGDSIVLRRPVGADLLGLGIDVVAFAGPGVAPFGAYPQDAPMSSTVTWESPRIVASLAALRGSFAPQNANHGRPPTGDITVVGSIAGRFSPPLRTPRYHFFGWFEGWRDFSVRLEYDQRLQHDPPPAMPALSGGGLRVVELDVG